MDFDDDGDERRIDERDVFEEDGDFPDEVVDDSILEEFGSEEEEDGGDMIRDLDEEAEEFI